MSNVWSVNISNMIIKDLHLQMASYQREIGIILHITSKETDATFEFNP